MSPKIFRRSAVSISMPGPESKGHPGEIHKTSLRPGRDEAYEVSWCMAFREIWSCSSAPQKPAERLISLRRDVWLLSETLRAFPSVEKLLSACRPLSVRNASAVGYASFPPFAVRNFCTSACA